jgi:microcystin-dependent protein
MSITTPLLAEDNGATSLEKLNDNFDALEVAYEAVVNEGSPLATSSVKGRVKLSTAPVDADEPTAVGTNDVRLNATTGLTEAEETFVASFPLSIVGVVLPYAGSSAPTGFLLCDGSAVSRSTYADLFDVIGTIYGAGNESTTFNLPDLRDRTPIGAGAGTVVATFVSRSSNVITVSGITDASNNEFQTGQAVLYSAPGGAITGLTHNTTYYVVRVSNTTFSLATTLANAQNGTVISLSSDGTGTQTFTVTRTTRTLGHTGGEETHAMSATEAISHKHTPFIRRVGNSGSTVNTWTSLASATTGTVTESSLTTTVDGNLVNDETPFGGNTAMNNMQPFIALNYIIKT